MKVLWTTPALDARTQIIDYIANDDPLAAIRMDELFTAAGNSLAVFPYMGHMGRVPETRELRVHKHYFLVYGIDKQLEIVYIKAVLHTSKKYPA